MEYRKLGKSGLKLPVISYGLWQNVNADSDINQIEEMIHTAFEHGVTHFDLANNYGIPNGSTEERFGEVLARGFIKHRDEIIISTKAGYDMWDGPYGDGGSRKYLFASLNQSLKRMGIEYVDIFYHHRFDPETDLMETMIALRDIVLQGKALYVGLSNYNHDQLMRAISILKDLHVPYVVAQNCYNIIDNGHDNDALVASEYTNTGFVAYSPIAQGRLTNKYIDGIPAESRAADQTSVYLNENNIDEELKTLLIGLKKIADKRGVSVVQLALLWALRNPSVTSLIAGFRTKEQLLENLEVANMLPLTEIEIEEIDALISK
ncbi:aldo/keto reductase [Mollicutes bacterium LVI A0078]|nr:aldo/keto reductase [Mollicutes bacterium LVI A0075]WOO90389.1 aldo/keto reductase [Mollicutes bacterium LVI A0078]